MFRQVLILWIFLGSFTVYWLGTRAGVARFDGANFVNFTAKDGLAENGVRAICEDNDGKIWFGHTGGGLSLFDGCRVQALVYHRRSRSRDAIESGGSY